MMLDEPLDRPKPISVAQRLLAGLHLDGPLLMALLTVCGLGLFVLYSAGGQNTRQEGHRDKTSIRLAVLESDKHPIFLSRVSGESATEPRTSGSSS